MIWLTLGILSLTEVSGRHHRSPSSDSDVARMGAAIVSRILHRHPEFLFSDFYRFTEEKNSPDVRRGGGKFIQDFLRLMGIDRQRMDDFAFDGFISLVRLLNRMLASDEGPGSADRRKSPRNLSLFRFILHQPRVVDLLQQMQDPRLVDSLLNESEDKLRNFREENVDCIRLLVCKIKPFVRGMQRSLGFFMRREDFWKSGRSSQSVRDPCEHPGRVPGRREEGRCQMAEEEALWEEADLETRMFFFFPALGEVLEDGDKCDRIFPHCLY